MAHFDSNQKMDANRLFYTTCVELYKNILIVENILKISAQRIQ